MQIEEVEPNVTLFQDGERRVYVVGTAHVSRASAELVERILRDIKPQAVCLELCPSRLQSLQNPDRWREMDLFEVFKTGKAHVLMSQLVLAAFQKRIAAQFGVKPGEEMRTAMRVADELGMRIDVIDRDVKITLKRAWAHAGFFGFAKILASLTNSLFSKETITEAEIEELKRGDALTALMSEFSEALPGVKTALIDERDQYMSTKLAACPGDTLVAVLGAGHLPGIRANYGKTANIEMLEKLPPKSTGAKLLVWLFPTLLVALLVWGFIHAGSEATLKVFGAWALCNMTGAAIGAMICLGHPLTILTAFLSAPAAVIHPVINVGTLCALVEAFLRKPRVQDLESVADDIATRRGIWTNRVSRLFLIFILANLGSLIGNVIGLLVAPKFAG